MHPSKKIIFALFILVFAIIACGPWGTSQIQYSRDDEVATIVAATLAADEAEKSVSEATPAAPAEDAPAAPSATEASPEPTDTPTLHPPVLKVVYIDQGNIWLWTEGVGANQLTTSGSVVDVKISEDGQVIAFVRQYDFTYEDLWAINADGSNERILVSQADFEAMPRDADYIFTQRPFQLGWVPGTHTLVYNTNPAFEGPGLFINDDLNLVDVDSGQRTHLLDTGFGGMFYYSPDGTQIALVTPESLSLVDATGGNRRDILTFPHIYTYSEWAFYPEPTWAADSSYLRVAIPPQDPMGNPTALTFVWHIPADGSLPHMAGEFVAAPVFRGAPNLSPDTHKVIFAYPIGEAFDQFELHHLDLTTNSDSVYLTGQFFLENWNPDSQRFVYTASSTQELFIGQIGAAATPATNQMNAFNPRWIDTERFVFYTKPPSGNDFYLNIGTPGNPSTVIGGPLAEPGSFDIAK